MAFVDSVFGESGLLELSVDVARENESAAWHAVRPSAQNREALVWDGVTVKLQTVPVEASRKLRVLYEPHVLEGKAVIAKRRIRAPEAFLTAEVRKARIDAHSRVGGN